jgi:hypothetical protein
MLLVMLPPLLNHRVRDLRRVADRSGFGFNHLMPSLAGAAVRIHRLVAADAPAGVAGLTFPHDVLSNAIVGQIPERLGRHRGEIWIAQRSLGIQWPDGKN